MSGDYSKPVRMSTSRMEAAITDPAELVMDPADVSAIAHATATALLSRGQSSDDAQVREALVRFADEHGLDTLAELWSKAHPLSLPGALWRLYLVRAVVRHSPQDTAQLFQRGVDGLPTIDAVVAGAPDPLSAEDFSGVLDDILMGAFDGDLAHALERAASVATAVSAGAISLALADDREASYLTSRSLTWSVIAQELEGCAARARKGTLT
jgi:hypothetical protein